MAYKYPPIDWTLLRYDTADVVQPNGGSISATPNGRGLEFIIPASGGAVDPFFSGPHVLWEMRGIYGRRVSGLDLHAGFSMVRELSPPDLTSGVEVYCGWVDRTSPAGAWGFGAGIRYEGAARRVFVWEYDNGDLQKSYSPTSNNDVRRSMASAAKREGTKLGYLRAEGFDDDGNFAGQIADRYNTGALSDLWWFVGSGSLGALAAPETVQVQGFGFAAVLGSGLSPT